ncbi:hypothetical protein LTR94_025777, partial [Friedmanniomyces endolithicus]
ALLHASELWDAANGEFAKIGIEVSPKLNLDQMHKAKDESVGQLTKGIEFLFKKNKVEWLKGKGKIVANGKVEVTAADGSVQTVETKNIVIATGSEPTPLPGVAFEEGKVIDSTGALFLPAVPKKLIVVGAGIIGLELGSVWRRLGAEVTVLEFLDRITPGMDTEVATTFQRTLTKQGMVFKLGAKVTAAKSVKDGVELTLEPAKGGEAETLKGDVVLVAIGRRPYTEGLGLETVDALHGVLHLRKGSEDHPPIVEGGLVAPGFGCVGLGGQATAVEQGRKDAAARAPDRDGVQPFDEQFGQRSAQPHLGQQGGARRRKAGVSGDQLGFSLGDIGPSGQQGRWQSRFRVGQDESVESAPRNRAGEGACQQPESILLTTDRQFQGRDPLRGGLKFGFGLGQFQARGLAGLRSPPGQRDRILARHQGAAGDLELGVQRHEGYIGARGGARYGQGRRVAAEATGL